MGYNFYLKFDLTGGRLHSVITVFQTVLVGVAGLVDDLLQPPGHGLDQGPQGFTVHNFNFAGSALTEESK